MVSPICRASGATRRSRRSSGRRTSRISCSAKKKRRGWRKSTVDRRDERNQPSDPNRPAPPKGGDGSTGAAGNVGGYNNFWLDPGERVARVDGMPRSSLVIDPPNGRVPALTDEARARGQQRMKMMAGRGQYDHPEFRPLAERCLLSFGPTTPLIPNYFYNNNVQIVQTPDHVMILMEMVHDARIVRIGGTHVPKHIRPWMGDSIGRWEGDTLVVETTNFPPQQQFRGASENLKVTERFRRVGRHHHQLPLYGRGPHHLHGALDGGDSLPGHGRVNLRVRVPRGKLCPCECAQRRAE